jgi:hypothetical protein
MKPDLSYRALAKYADGEVTASQAAALADAIAQSPEAQRRLARVESVAASFADASAVEGIDLLPGLRKRLPDEAGRVERPRARWRSTAPLGFAVAAAAAAVVLPVVLAKRAPTPGPLQTEFRAKSAAANPDPRSRWIALNAFRLSGNGPPEPLHGVLHVDDGLLFSYTNLGPAPFSHLMVFGIDEQRHVYWYYPAFLDPRDNPTGITIEKGASRVALDEVVAHRYRAGRLTVFGLFSDRAFSVSDVERAVEHGTGGSAALEAALDGARVKSLPVEVVR